jgi:hypothetical protein
MVARRLADMPTALGALFGTPSPGVRAGGRGWEAVTTANSRFSNASYLGTYQAMTGSAGLQAERVLSKSVGVSAPISNEGPGTKDNTVWPPGEFQAANAAGGKYDVRCFDEQGWSG